MIKGVQILGIAFNDAVLEIEYMDENKQSAHVAEVSRLYLEREKFEGDAATLEQLILELIDEALTVRRNPPETLERS